MKNEKEIEQEILVVEVPIDGELLTVIAQKISNRERARAVQNEFGLNSNWDEFFPTAQQAIDAGIYAIENEGAQEFTSIEGFERLSRRYIL
jgi:hypothetical protein